MACEQLEGLGVTPFLDSHPECPSLPEPMQVSQGEFSFPIRLMGSFLKFPSDSYRELNMGSLYVHS
jgi:hypothetical protein